MVKNSLNNKNQESWNSHAWTMHEQLYTMHGPCMDNYTLVHKWRHKVFGFVIKETGMVGVQNETNRWMIYLFGKGVTIF